MNKIVKNSNIIIFTIGTLLIFLSFCLIFYDKFVLLKSNVFDDVELSKYRENGENKIVTDIDNNENSEEEVTLEDVDIQEVSNEEEKPVNETKKTVIKKEFIGYLEIKKLNLKQGLVSKNSYYNNVNYNIQTLSVSDYPDKDKGNVILAAHSGTSSVSYFKNLYKLSLGDEAIIYYKNYVYTYKIVDIYYVPKVGKAVINRDTEKNCLTLITCTKNDKKSQTIYILELSSKVKESDN